jgi:hypothetical protein
MRERSVFRVLVLSSLITFGIGLVVVLFELLQSISVSRMSGIGLAAGGFSEKFIALMVIGLPVVFALVYFLLSPKRLSPVKGTRRRRE